MLIVSLFNKDKTSATFEYDFTNFVRFYVALLIGFRKEFFNTIKDAMMIFLLFGLFFNFFSLFTAQTFIRVFVEEKTLSYKLQYMLLPAFFYLIFYDNLSVNEKRIVLFSVFLYALEQIIFQKRLPTTRVFVSLLFYIYSISIFSNNVIKIGFLIKRIGLILTGVLITFQLFTLLGFDIIQYGELLIERFYTSDSIEATLEEDSRWLIGETFYQSLESSGQFISGRGIGGVVYDNDFLMSDENGRPYRSAAELGLPTMILKGGLPLVLFFLYVLIKFILMSNRVRKNIYLFANWTVVIIWFIFLYAEGFIGNNSSPYEIIIGFSMGLILSNPSNYDINKMTNSNV